VQHSQLNIFDCDGELSRIDDPSIQVRFANSPARVCFAYKLGRKKRRESEETDEKQSLIICDRSESKSPAGVFHQSSTGS